MFGVDTKNEEGDGAAVSFGWEGAGGSGGGRPPEFGPIQSGLAVCSRFDPYK